MHMRLSFITHSKVVRILTIITAMTIFGVLATANTIDTFSQTSGSSSFTLPFTLSSGVSLFIALIFLLVGSLVWFYAQERKVALLLGTFCYVSMMPFELESASLIDTSGKSWLTLISHVSSLSAIFLLTLLLLTFPKNFFALARSVEQRPNNMSMFGINISFLYGYIALIFSLFFLIIAYFIFIYFAPIIILPLWVSACALLFESFLLFSCIVTVIISFQRSSKRERTQLRFFTIGTIFAFLPLLLLTILPETIRLPSINPQITTLSVVLLPVSLGYSILRYQLLVFDTYIRRTVRLLVGIIFLTILVYIAIIAGNWDAHIFTYIVLASIVAILAPTFWWMAQLVTERILFRESLHYRQLINEPIKLIDETLSLDHAAQLITVAAIQALETPQVCLFTFSEESGCYHLAPGMEEGQQDASRQTLMRRLLSSSRLLVAIPSLPDAIELQTAVEERLRLARRPLLGYEAVRSPGETPVGLGRYFTSTAPDEHTHVLLAPIRAQGKMIGLLVLGERGDQQSFAGPDFEIIELLLARFAPLLETARLQDSSRRYTTMLNDLYQVNTIPADESQTLESVASAYASVAARSLQVGVEVWTCQGEAKNERYEMHPLLLPENGSRLIATPTFSLTMQQKNWNALFFSGKDAFEHQAHVLLSSSLSTEPHSPFAWLPLKKKSGAPLGVLLLTYGRPHQFLKNEIQLLEMFAEQCAASLENTSITIELRAAYERQKELDLLKDQFIMTASHELRTPLTAVLGYLELLTQYHDMLDKATSADFIAKAHRGCNELMLMVNNIMDANQMQFTIDRTKMECIQLSEAVTYIVEMLDGIAKRGQRQVHVTIAEDLYVQADTIRLHQIVLNLLGNAFKYSPTTTPIDISASQEGDMIWTRIRDYGPGIPLEEQTRLFERFVRLERDMNSPERGTGLGLYICKRLVHAMGGNIWIESSGQEGEGSTFIFSLRNASTLPDENAQLPQSLSTLR